MLFVSLLLPSSSLNLGESLLSVTRVVNGIPDFKVIGITQPPPPKDGARNALFSNLYKSDLDNYVVKRSKRHLLEEVSWSRIPCPKGKGGNNYS